MDVLIIINNCTIQYICKTKNCVSKFMISEKTLDDIAMDSMFTMSVHTPRRYILELLLIQSAHTY